MGAPQKLRNSLQSSNPTSGNLSKGTEIRILKRFLPSQVQSSIIHNMMDEWIKKMGYTHVGGHYSALKKEDK